MNEKVIYTFNIEQGAVKMNMIWQLPHHKNVGVKEHINEIHIYIYI